MKILGITGSSGSGKTTVSKLFEKMKSVYIINTDEMARNLDEKGSKYLTEIEDFFGKDILLENGKLNRKKMSQIIFENENYKEELNKITKRNLLPKMLDEINMNSDKNVIVLDIPILFENKLEEYCDKVLVVISDKEEQIKRICKRDNIDEKTAIQRLKTQKENVFYTEKANYVINNTNKTEEDLLKEIEKIYKEILEGNE